MAVFKRSLVRGAPPRSSLMDFGTQRRDTFTPVVCAYWLWAHTDLPGGTTRLYICVADRYVRDAFFVRLADDMVYVDRRRAWAATYGSLRRLIRRHGREVGQSEWIAWIWFEYNPNRR